MKTVKATYITKVDGDNFKTLVTLDDVLLSFDDDSIIVVNDVNYRVIKSSDIDISTKGKTATVTKMIFVTDDY